MVIIDLSAEFDIVNIKLLRLFYVDVYGENYYLKTLDNGTIQGSRLQPTLNAIYISQLFDLKKMTYYADDNLIKKCHNNLKQLIIDMKKSLEVISNPSCYFILSLCLCLLFIFI